jgi:energy-coupling factor transporter ATP-binding protein EcfA2
MFDIGNKIMFTFKHPTTVLIAGPTQCGKTYFFIRALKNGLIQPEPQRIVWVFSEWQDAYTELLRDLPQVQFVKDFHAQLYESFDPRVRNLLVLDDQMENRNMHRRSNESLVKFFTQGSHHRNLTVVYIVQNLFNQDRSMRTVSLNAHYLVLFKNPRDATQIHTVASQMFPGNSEVLLGAFKDATATPIGGSETRGYLVLDLHPTTCDALRILTNVFDEQPVAYIPQEYIKESASPVDVERVPVSPDGFSTTLSSDRRTSASYQRKGASPIRKKAKQRIHQTNGKVPIRVLKPARISSSAKRRNRRRNQGNL